MENAMIPNPPVAQPVQTRRDTIAARKPHAKRLWVDRRPDNPVSTGNDREINHE